MHINKSTKGALAASAAGVLLLGGAGSLAYWTSTQDVTGANIDTGHLKLVSPDCGVGWVLDGGATYGAQLLVPGDTLTKVCSFTVDASGAHLTADFDATSPEFSVGDPALLDELGVTATYEVNAVGVASTDVPVVDGDVIEATVVVSWPYGVEDNDSNVLAGLSATLDTITVTATQSHDNTP
jgi:alternate signal-mediated exported protein